MSTARASCRPARVWWVGPALVALAGSGAVAVVAVGPTFTGVVVPPRGLQVGAVARAPSLATTGTPPPASTTARPPGEGDSDAAGSGVDSAEPGTGDNAAEKVVVVPPQRAVVVWSGGRPLSTAEADGRASGHDDAAEDRAEPSGTGTPSVGPGAEPSESGD